jgi:hypothetical protein
MNVQTTWLLVRRPRSTGPSVFIGEANVKLLPAPKQHIVGLQPLQRRGRSCRVDRRLNEPHSRFRPRGQEIKSLFLPEIVLLPSGLQLIALLTTQSRILDHNYRPLIHTLLWFSKRLLQHDYVYLFDHTVCISDSVVWKDMIINE